MTPSATPPRARILVIEDEAPIRRFLRACLETQEFEVQEALTGKEGLALAAANAPDIVLLDLGLPDIDGQEVLRRLREFSSRPVIVLSARGQDRDKIEALDGGADDYLTKPFSTGELLARIRVAMRHGAAGPNAAGVASAPDAVIFCGLVRIDLGARRVTRAGAEIRLTPNEWKLLSVLARNAGRVVTQKQLLTEVWGTTRATQEHYVRVYLHQLRQKLEENPADPAILVTEPWVGYRLNPSE